jgi:hypothetical protein
MMSIPHLRTMTDHLGRVRPGREHREALRLFVPCFRLLDAGAHVGIAAGSAVLGSTNHTGLVRNGDVLGAPPTADGLGGGAVGPRLDHPGVGVSSPMIAVRA